MPKIRVGCYPTATPGMRFIGLTGLGPHGYGHQPDEGNGIVYTCRAGHIDITHVRACADWTKYIDPVQHIPLLMEHVRQAAWQRGMICSNTNE